MRKRLLFLSMLMFLNTAFAANDVVNTPVQNTVTLTTQANTAKSWQLSDTEWENYLKLMQGASGHYYQNLPPPEVLGINADTPDALRHFAKIAAKLEHDKLEQELRFNVAFHDAASRLYAAEPMIKPFDFSPFTPIPKR